MRENLFRGKRTDSGGWAQGIPLAYDMPYGVRAVIVQSFAPLSKMVECVSVDPETVGEYVGLPDKSGVKIFEGDIVSFSAEEYFKGDGRLAAVDRRGEIVFCEGAFMILSENSYFALSKSAVKAYDLAVIGNIHDNPSLLTA